MERLDFATSLSRISTDLWTHSALSAVVELGLLDQLRAPRTVSELYRKLGLERPLTEAVLDLLVEADALERDGDRVAPTDGFEAYLDEPLKLVLTAELRSDRLQAADLVARSRAGELHGGWDHTDRQLLEAQGETGRIFRIAMDFLLPQLDGLIDSPSAPAQRSSMSAPALAFSQSSCAGHFARLGHWRSSHTGPPAPSES